ncbi:MAG TPA: acyl-CoA dehydrogenase C-terminal domain-containing protein, partial [Caldimonas sp.]|nr:acyl-CoA dehydrogenase C-terminal domain-containing protein [Caldimonas sp.]
AALQSEIDATALAAAASPSLAGYAQQLKAAAAQLGAATSAAWATGSADEALANATPYLQAFGHVVIAWMWLSVATIAVRAVDDAAQRGRLAACRYFFAYELPKIAAWLGVVERRDDTCRTLAEESF